MHFYFVLFNARGYIFPHIVFDKMGRVYTQKTYMIRSSFLIVSGMKIFFFVAFCRTFIINVNNWNWICTYNVFKLMRLLLFALHVVNIILVGNWSDYFKFNETKSTVIVASIYLYDMYNGFDPHLYGINKLYVDCNNNLGSLWAGSWLVDSCLSNLCMMRYFQMNFFLFLFYTNPIQIELSNPFVDVLINSISSFVRLPPIYSTFSNTKTVLELQFLCIAEF